MDDVTQEQHQEEGELDITEETDGKATTSQSEALKAIVDFEEESSDVNTELFRSTIRTTPLDSDKKQVGVDELLRPDGSTDPEKDEKSEEAAALEKIEKDALKVADDGEERDKEEELASYEGEEEKKEGEDWTIVRCSSVDISSAEEGMTTAADKGKMEEDNVSLEESREDTDEDKSFEIIDEKEVEAVKEDGDKNNGHDMEKDSENLEERNDSRTLVTVPQDDIYEVSLKDEEIAKLTETGSSKQEEKLEDKNDGVEDPLKVNMALASPTVEGIIDVEVDEGKAKEKSDGSTKDKAGNMEVNFNLTNDQHDNIPSSSSGDADDGKFLPEFDELQVGIKLDSNAQKSRARLAKTGALAQRRKPPRSSWYVEEGRNLQEFMFTDSTEPKPLKEVKEDEEQVKGPSTRTPPKPARRLPPGAVASPMVLPGFGQIGKFKLKKTTPTEPVKSPPGTKASPKSPPPTATRPSPTTRTALGPRVLPIPTKRNPVHSKGKAPTPPEAKSSAIPVSSYNTSSKSPTEKKSPTDKVTSPKEPLVSPKEVVNSHKDKSPKEPLVSPKEIPSATSPKEPLTSPRGTAFRLPPPSAAKPKPRPKPLPKPRPQSIAVTGVPTETDPMLTREARTSVSSRDDLNSDILNNSMSNASLKDHKASTSPKWIQDTHKKLPPITSPSKTKEEAVPANIPKWKQEILKKRKEQEALEPGPSRRDDSRIKKSIVPPPLPKKDENSNKPPFTTVPQWQLDLAEKNRKKKEDTKEDGVSRPPKERKTEDSNKIENKKPPLTPKPAIAPKKKFDAIPPTKDSVPSWQKSALERRKKNEKNLLIENGEKKDSEKPAEITSSTKKVFSNHKQAHDQGGTREGVTPLEIVCPGFGTGCKNK